MVNEELKKETTFSGTIWDTPEERQAEQGNGDTHKNSTSFLYEPINHLFQLIDKKPHSMHLITPIHKSGDRSMINNYRPISLLCAISKVLESLIYNGIIDFVSKVINKSPFRFSREKSQLLVFLNDITNSHFHKAFDSVPHCELLQKLKNIGIDDKMWLWFKEYLSGRFQCTSIPDIILLTSTLRSPSG